MIFYIISGILFLSGAFLIIINLINNKRRKINLIKRKWQNYAILIPARYEAKVIRDLLDSLKDQISSFKDTYIIVESENDETVTIAKEYGANIFIRTELENRHRKGFALDEVLKEILKNKHYDLYFIFDADNILDKDFIKEMLNSYNDGYDIAVAYRSIKNNINWVTTCSGLTFSMINTIFNKTNIKFNKSVIISGTGYYISGEIIEKLGGFPFNSLTEDYELSLYVEANHISCTYNEKAIFYDEQPTSFKTSIKQRTRWVKGFFEARKKRAKELKDFSRILGVTPYILMVIGAIIAVTTLAINLVINIINNDNYSIYLFYLLLVILFIYLILMIFTICMFILEKGKLNVSKKQMKLAIILNPIFLLSYIHCLVKSLTTKVTWEKIEHGK